MAENIFHYKWTISFNIIGKYHVFAMKDIEKCF